MSINSLAKTWKKVPISIYSEIVEFGNLRETIPRQHLDVILLHPLLSMSSKAFPKPWMLTPLGNHLQNNLKNKNIIRCHLLDARNHGHSKHIDEFGLQELVIDLELYLLQNKIEQPLLIGHSMGAKTAMMYSLLKKSSNIKGLISIEASPSNYQHNHQNLFNAMKKVNLSTMKHKLQIDECLLKDGKIQSKNERAFIMENLVYDKEIEQFKWLCNIDIIKKNEYKKYINFHH